MTSETKSAIELTDAGRPWTWGFRFSPLDAAVLVGAVAVTIAGYDATAGFSMLLLFVVLHFFLFCNVFRIRRKPELIWAGTFLTNGLFWILIGQMNVITVSLSQCFVTIFLILREIRLPCYHGVFARTINPRLDDYLADRLVHNDDESQ